MSNYVIAGFESLGLILNRFMKSDDFNDNFTEEQLSNFFIQNCNKLLHSYGQYFPGRKKFNKYDAYVANIFAKNKANPFFKGCEFIIDSGAFQVSVGRLDRREGDLLFHMYYEFLQKHVDVYDKAFVLDFPLGPDCCIENTSDNLYFLNSASYHIAANLPDNVRDKLIYIHHFRTPGLWNAYTRVLDEDDMFNKFNYHATGGLVINMTGDMAIPCIICILPLIPLLNRALKYNRTKLHFHILGGSGFRDILFYQLFQRLVKDYHGIDLVITYDSSAIFKALMVGRNFFLLDGAEIKKINIRSKFLPHNYGGSKSIFELYNETIHKFCEDQNFKLPKTDYLYDKETGTFFEEYRTYSILYSIWVYAEVEKQMEMAADELYTIYKSGDIELFNQKIELVTRGMNSGRITKKQTVKSYSVSKSLDLLRNLDEDYCEYVVNKFLVRDEFIDRTDTLVCF